MKLKQAARYWPLCASVAVFVYVCILRPIVGIADNGDFLRVMGSAALEDLDPNSPREDKYFGFFVREYKMTESGMGEYFSTQVPLVRLATWLNQLAYNRTLFDIRFLAVIYMLLLLTAFVFVIRSHRTLPAVSQALLGFLLFGVFTDVGYIGYFNSLYGEPVSYVFLLLVFGSALAIVSCGRPSLMLLGAFFVCAFCLTGSKIQNAPIGVLTAVLGIRFIRLRRDAAWRSTTVVLSTLLALGSIGMYVWAPKQFKEINLYQTVFYGVLKDSPTPEKDLTELGLPADLSVLAGTNFFTPNTPIPQRDPKLYGLFYNKISHAKIVAFWIGHPARLLDKLEAAAKQSMTIRPYYLGTYEKREGMPRGAVSDKFGIWSGWKGTIVPNTLRFLIPFYFVYFLVIWRIRSAADADRKRYPEAFALIGLIGIVSFVIPVIGDGEADLSKHLFLFNVCFDVMFVSGLLWGVQQIIARPVKKAGEVSGKMSTNGIALKKKT